MTPNQPPSARLLLGATGVVFGDIGTSPLYAFRESFVGHHRLALTPDHVLGVLSMLVWALILVVTVKYVFVTMRADNRGEGGSFALLALIQRIAPRSPWLPAIGSAALLATALFYGDAMITPAISILSAVEGLTLIDPRASAWIIPVTLVIVAGLFAVQHRGTARLSTWFGPVMLIWFATIAVLGGLQVARFPQVLAAANPGYALGFLVRDPLRAFFTLGTVVLAVTGAEALYADMGHFGRRAIGRAWIVLALPALLLCYAGQSALVLTDPAAIENPFYRLAPPALLVPLILLASVATVIASQSIITGAFSVTHQAVRLGYLPRLEVRETSTERGQVYAPAVNATLFVAVVLLILGFRSSSALAAAFGLAVTATMVLTTGMIGFMVFRVWRWPWWWAAPLFVVLLALDLGLFAASATKFLDGGWLPTMVALVLGLLFATWRRGRALVAARVSEEAIALDRLRPELATCFRPAGTAVYLTRTPREVPDALIQNLRHNGVLHSRVILLTVDTALVPTVAASDRIRTTDLGDGIERIVLRFGFMEDTDVQLALTALVDPPAPMRTSFFLSRQRILSGPRPGMARWRERLFATMMRASETPMAAFRLPLNRVVELGVQIEI